MTLFESPFVDSSLSERENNALRASSLLAVPPPPPEVLPLEGLQGVDLPEANLTQWASYVQDVASGMWRPPCAATSCPTQDMAGVLHRLENLTGVGFCCLCYTLGSNCGCSRATHQAPRGYGGQALWVPPQPSYASMASSTITTASTSMRDVSPTVGPPPGFPARGASSPMDMLLAPQSCNLLAHAGVGRGLRPQSTAGSTRPWAPGTIGLCQEQPLALRKLAAASGSHEATPATPYQQVVHPPLQVRFAPPSPRLKLLVVRVRVWPKGEDHKLESMEVARNWPLIPEQRRTGPPPEDLKSEEELPVKTQWIASWTSYPQVGRGT